MSYPNYDGKTCYNMDSTIIALHELPVFSIEGPTDTCENTRIALTGNSVEGLSYKWTDTLGNHISSLKSHTFLITKDTTVKLTASNSLGCSSSLTHTVKMHKLPSIKLDTITENVCKGAKGLVRVSNTETNVEEVQYQWTSWGEQGAILNRDSITPKVLKQTQYTVTASNVYTNTSNNAKGYCPSVNVV